MKSKEETILLYLEKIYPNAACELNYQKDYELLIATVLSAQCKDKRVNEVTKVLWENYDIYSLAKEDPKNIERIIKTLGSGSKKSNYIVDIAKHLVKDYEGKVPNDRKYLESLKGVGRKTCNVVLSNLFFVPAIAVDTHVQRVSKRLALVNEKDDVLKIEKKLMKKFPQDKWSKLHHQLVLFGRYECKAKNPNCSSCGLKRICKYYQKENNQT